MSLLTLEDVRLLQNFELAARYIVRGTLAGRHRSPLQGFSVTFSEHRPYAFGEDIRHMDWKVYARSRRLYVKRYEEETNFRCLMVVDCSASMRLSPPDGSKLLFALYSAAALSYLLHRQRDAFGMCLVWGEECQWSNMGTSPTHLQNVFALLEWVRSGSNSSSQPTALTQALHEVAERLPVRSMVVMFTDSVDRTLMETLSAQTALKEIEKALSHLRARHHDLIYFHVYDRLWEAQLHLPRGQVRLYDPEMGSEVEVSVAEVRPFYEGVFRKFVEGVRRVCQRTRTEMVEVSVGEPFLSVLLPFLARRRRYLV